MTSHAAPPCETCRGTLPFGTRFCPHCGRAIERGETHAGERRQITVVFCDLVGSTPLGRRLDAEDFHEVISTYQEAVGRVVRELDGHIGQYLGDGVLVYFGYPSAHENDALRAVNAALRIRAALPELERAIIKRVPAMSGEPVKLRFGIYTGLVILSATGSGPQERQALGDTVNLAARLQSVAGADEILISDATHRLVQDAFIVERVDLHSLKGVDESVPAWRVLKGASPHDRLAGRGVSQELPLVGRGSELAGLLDRWERARQGHGEALLVVGEPGVGKSRLLTALYERTGGQGTGWLECQCSALHQNSAFQPVITLLEKKTGLHRGEALEEQIRCLEKGIESARLPLRQSMPLMANLLSLALPPTYPAEPVGSEERRRRTLECLVAWLLDAPRREPHVLVVEDLHWVDDSTRELLGFLMSEASGAAILLVMTARPDFPPPWPKLERVVLRPLRPAHSQEIIRRLAGDRDLTPEIIAEITARSDGVPLFLEEITKSVLEEGEEGREASAIGVPFTIQDSLNARIDRLGAVRPLAQIAAVIGREFSRDLLCAVCADEPAQVANDLERIEKSGLVHCHDRERGIYVFKHALIRDAAYESLLRGDRREYHLRVAKTLETLAPGVSDTAPEVIANHFEEAGSIERAVFHYANAGRDASRKSAHVETIGHLRHALELNEQLAAGPERDRREFELLVALGPALIARFGYGDPAAERTFARAHELSHEIGAGPLRLQAVYGLSTYYQARADLSRSIQLAEECLALAEQAGDPAVRMLGHLRLGLSLFYAGEHARGLAHHLEVAALYDPREHRRLAYVYGQDPGALAEIYAGLALWALGYPTRAQASCDRARQLAADSGHPHTQAFVAGFAAALHQMLGDSSRTEELATESIALAEKHGFVLWTGFSGALRGWARAARQVDVAGAVESVRNGVEQLTRIGMIVGQSYFFGLLAESQLAAGDEDGALASIDHALTCADTTGIVYWKPELLRLRAAQSQGGDSAAALTTFDAALQLARRQGARSHELRIAMSMSRLLQDLGHGDEARALLGPICASFAEDGDSRDVFDARRLLAQIT